MKPKARKKAAPKPAPVELPPGAPVVLDRQQLAKILGCSQRLINAQIAAGKIPPPDFHVGSLTRWNKETIDAWRGSGQRGPDMASVYKRRRNGVEAARYTCAWVGPDGRTQTCIGTTDKATSWRIANHREAVAKLEREGVVERGERQRKIAAGKRVEDHANDYRLDLIARGREQRHCDRTARTVVRVLASAGISSVAEMDPVRIQAAVARIKASGRSAATANAALTAVKSFVNWLWHSGRIREYPPGVKALAAFNAKTDRRRVRRALTPDQLDHLIRTTEAGPDQYCYGPTKSKSKAVPVTGPDRAVIYRLAAATGYRAGEIRSLTRESFELDGPDPAVTCRKTKNGRIARQPIRTDLAARLRAWLDTRPAEGPLVVLPWDLAQMLRRDLEAANIPYRTPEGVADFHSLRAAYVTHLIMRGVPLPVVQKLARHSTPELTSNVYTRATGEDLRAAVEKE